MVGKLWMKHPSTPLVVIIMRMISSTPWSRFFPDKHVNLESLKQCKPKSADYLYSVDVKLSSDQNSKWPKMNSEQSPVFKELKKI